MKRYRDEVFSRLRGALAEPVAGGVPEAAGGLGAGGVFGEAHVAEEAGVELRESAALAVEGEVGPERVAAGWGVLAAA